MKVPLLDLKAQLAPIENEIKEAVCEVIDSAHYILGPKVEEFEDNIAHYMGVEHAVAVSSGTDALLVSLTALGIGPGDIVITTPYSFFATAGVVARLNATPAFVDIDPATYNMSPEALRQWFDTRSDKISKVKAILPIHLFGQCADMDPILEIAARYDIPVVEDAAQAIGTDYPSKTGTRKAGAMGALGCLSFYPTKNLGAMGDGGMVVTGEAGLAQKLRILRMHGETKKHHHALIGGNFRFDPIQAAILLVKLPHLDQWHSARRKNAAYYDANLNIEGIVKPAIPYGRENHIYNQYIVSVPDRRDDLKQYLAENDIATAIYYPLSFHEQECFRYLGYGQGEFPHSEHASRHTIALPIYPELAEAMQDHVIEKMNEFFGVSG